MVLNPPSYSCPDDHSDLTGLVTGALSGDGLAVATRTLTVTGLPATEPVTVLARGGTEQCRSSLGTGSAPPTLSCGKTS